MIIVDTSVWIDYFNASATPQTILLNTVLGDRMIGIADLILTEVLQGVKSDQQFTEVQNALASVPVFSILGPERAIRCARNYRTLRRRGITVPKTADVIIATFCIEEGHSLLFSDRDFEPFVDHLGLSSAC
jgi:predicted nucleic acid-binding protein